jgi:DNA-directed RNA polymerase subunit N (RpoN/RPB10)
LGVHYDFFRLARAALIREHVANNPELHGIEPNKLTLVDNSLPDMKELLEAMGIKKSCCKMRMTTGAPISDVFISNMTTQYSINRPSPASTK